VTGRESFSSVSVRAGEGARVCCHRYPSEAPILSLDAGEASLSITVGGRNEVTAWAVEFARQIVREAERFAAECERMHAAQQAQGAPPDNAAADDAA
jgi:hypothetical protein